MGDEPETGEIVPPAVQTTQATLDSLNTHLALIDAQRVNATQIQTTSALARDTATLIDTVQSEIDVLRADIQSAETSIASARAELAAYTSIQGSVQTLINALADVRAEAESAVNDAVSLLRLDQWLRDTGRYARVMLVDAFEGQQSAAARAALTPKTTHRPVAGESVYALSQRYYGNPHDWRRITEANNTTSLEFDGTEQLDIPA